MPDVYSYEQVKCFAAKVRAALSYEVEGDITRYTQEKLAQKIHIDPDQLCHILQGSKEKAWLNNTHVEAIIRALLEWKKIDAAYAEEMRNCFRSFYCPESPTSPRHFVGRAKLLDEIKNELGEENNLIIYGLPGSGKSTLAQKAAYDLGSPDSSARYFRAVIALTIGKEPDKFQIILNLAQHFGPVLTEQLLGPAKARNRKSREKSVTLHNSYNEFDLTQKAADSIKNILEKKCHSCNQNPVLIILDDLWDAEIIDWIKKIIPTSVFLITTLSKKVANLGGFKDYKISLLENREAVQFLQYYLGNHSVEEFFLQQIAEAVYNHPLALVKIAEFLRSNPFLSFSIENWLKRYQNEEADTWVFPELGEILDIDEQQSMKELAKVFRQLYDNLAETDKLYFRQLGVLPLRHPFDFRLLRAIWGLSQAETALVCNRLFKASFFEFEQGQPGLETALHSYAQHLLKNKIEKNSTYERYRQELLKIAAEDLVTGDSEWLFYLPHFKAVSKKLLKDWETQQYDQTFQKLFCEFVVATAKFYAGTNSLENPTLLEKGLTAAQLLNDLSAQRFLNGELGAFWIIKAKPDLALNYYNSALSLATGTEQEAASLADLGVVYAEQENWEVALEKYAAALALTVDANEKAFILCNQSEAFYNLAEKAKAVDLAKFNFYLEKARQVTEKALFLLKDVPDKAIHAFLMSNLAAVLYKKDYLAEAIKYFKRALQIHDALHNYAGQIETLFTLAKISQHSIEMLNYIHQAKALFPELDELTLAEFEPKLADLENTLVSQTNAQNRAGYE